MASQRKASEVVALLDLKPHPDGGYYSETFRDSDLTLSKSQLPPQYKVDRAVSTAIYFLLPSGDVALLHRLPCAEVFHFYGGEPVTVFELHDDGQIKLTVLGLDFDAGQRPQYAVQPKVWFSAFPTFDVASYSADGSALVKAPSRNPDLHYSLVGVTCAPGFQFEDNEMASLRELIPLSPKAEPFFRYLIRD